MAKRYGQNDIPPQLDPVVQMYLIGHFSLSRNLPQDWPWNASAKWLRKSEDVTYEFTQRTRGIQNGLNDDTLDIDSRLWQANGAIRALKEERGELNQR